VTGHLSLFVGKEFADIVFEEGRGSSKGAAFAPRSHTTVSCLLVVVGSLEDGAILSDALYGSCETLSEGLVLQTQQGSFSCPKGLAGGRTRRVGWR
jgi:hypothetical protein